LDGAEHLAERKRLDLLKHPETKRGVAPGKAGGKAKTEMISSFAQDAADRTGVTSRAVRQDVQIAGKIPEDVRDQIRETPAGAVSGRHADGTARRSRTF
jgi:hypothetical protein